MRGLKDKVAIVAGAAPGNIRAATESLALHVPLPVELSIALEGRLRVSNAPATGTRVRAEIPLPLELSTGC